MSLVSDKNLLKQIWQSALNILAIRDHSKKELKQKLAKKGYEIALIDQVINELLNKRFLDEARFTESFINYRRKKGQGPERIRQELNSRGIPDQIIAEQLSLADNDWSIDARLVWQKHFKGKPPANYNEKAKQMRFLQYRGFSIEHFNHLFSDDEI